MNKTAKNNILKFPETLEYDSGGKGRVFLYVAAWVGFLFCVVMRSSGVW